MNIHHLELFYFVAKHGGIAAAVRNIPYGIQQPAISGQIAKLEKSLGTKLFQRRPFAVSPTGMELFEFIRPFFDNIDIVAEGLAKAVIQQYVAPGCGIGLTVAVPGFKPPPQLRALPLSDFPLVLVGVGWSGKISDVARQLLAELDVEAETQRARIRK